METALSKPVQAPVEQADSRYAWYVVFVMMTCFALSFIDRQILSLLVGPIKSDLGVSDTRIGLLQGLAFALFYTVLGLPMGRFADRRSRRNVIAAGVFFWCVMTAVCAAAASFRSLFIARIGVGVGEATLGPSALSLISDYFPKERLASALSVYSLGIYVGSGLALIVGGAVINAVSATPTVEVPLLGLIASWRLTFLIVGLPGLLVGLLVYTVREPLRRNLIQRKAGQSSHLRMGEALVQLSKRWRSIAGICLGLGTQATCFYAQQAWLPTLLIRVHKWSPGRTGLVLGLMTLVTGCFGVIAGGRLCDYWLQQGTREAPLKLALMSTIAAAAFFCAAVTLGNAIWLLILIAPALFFLAMPVGSVYAAMPLIIPNQLRGLASALIFLSTSLGGLMMGPFLIGFANDYVFRNANLIGYSLALTVALAATASVSIFRAAYGPYRMDYALLHESPQESR